ncbi:uncharacterized protein LOC132277598 [Cornus florida]|uniref:uncharacterized protein LOC132277598 n=1 Tax=Cornus florida TaxID=4283 RepID=UPI0028A190F1|nr:uncharacterized protein LOC132277598 [Cornus florida]
MRCLAPDGTKVIDIHGDQVAAKEYYSVTMKYAGKGKAPIRSIDQFRPERTTRVGERLIEEEKQELVDLLSQNANVFAWSHLDMPGIDPLVSCHSLNVNPSAKPIKQKQRRFTPERNRIIAEEVDKLLDAGFPLPKIDQMVDATTGYERLTFLDAYSGYNQIPMDPADKEKTSFVTERGTYCYKVMPFGLKNAGATYQRLISKIFKEQIGKTVEAYIDDMVVKSKKKADHVQHLRDVFDVLRRYGMKLNPTKCLFSVSSGQFLGHVVNLRGIEASPAQADALTKNVEPTTIKENLPVLSAPESGEKLFLYLGVSSIATSGVLVRYAKGKQYPVFYISKTMTEAERRYSKAERVILSLVYAKRKLRHYFESHHIIVLTTFPIRIILHKPDLSERMTKWAIELSSFDITYEPRTAVKGQAVADFLLECDSEDVEEDLCKCLWKLFVDGSSNQMGAGIGIKLQTPEGTALSQALQLEFAATNNEAEYEALLAGIKLAKELKVRNLNIFSDSQLVVRQVRGEYETKDETMEAYRSAVMREAENFEKIEFIQIPRECNEDADRLACSASGSGETLVRVVPVGILNQPSIFEEPSGSDPW